MKKIIYTLFACLIFASCDSNTAEVDMQAVVIEKTYTPSSTTMMYVPYNIGKVHSIRMQPVHHSEQFYINVKFVDNKYTNYGTTDERPISPDEFNSIHVGDTVFVKCYVKINNK